MTGQYDDIINLPHHVSPTRPQMTNIERASQFLPFAALSGYDAAIEETARLTDAKIELDEHAKAMLDMKQQILIDVISDHPQVTVVYFKADERKSGGQYLTVVGMVKKVDLIERVLVMTSGQSILFDDILDIEAEIFEGCY